MKKKNKYPTFHRAILALGLNDQERSQILGIPERSIQYLRAGVFPRNMEQIFQHPDLVMAIYKDSEKRAAEAASEQSVI